MNTAGLKSVFLDNPTRALQIKKHKKHSDCHTRSLCTDTPITTDESVRLPDSQTPPTKVLVVRYLNRGPIGLVRPFPREVSLSLCPSPLGEVVPTPPASSASPAAPEGDRDDGGPPGRGAGRAPGGLLESVLAQKDRLLSQAGGGGALPSSLPQDMLPLLGRGLTIGFLSRGRSLDEQGGGLLTKFRPPAPVQASDAPLLLPTYTLSPTPEQPEPRPGTYTLQASDEGTTVGQKTVETDAEGDLETETLSPGEQHDSAWVGRVVLVRDPACLPPLCRQQTQACCFPPHPGLSYADHLYNGSRLRQIFFCPLLFLLSLFSLLFSPVLSFPT